MNLKELISWQYRTKEEASTNAPAGFRLWDIYGNLSALRADRKRFDKNTVTHWVEVPGKYFALYIAEAR